MFDYIDKPTVSIRFEPPSPIIENDRVNVTLHCDVVDGNPRKLLKVQWMINGDVLTELPECDGTYHYSFACIVAVHTSTTENCI